MLPSWACTSRSVNSPCAVIWSTSPASSVLRQRRSCGTLGGNCSGNVSLSGWLEPRLQLVADEQHARCRPAWSSLFEFDAGGFERQRARLLGATGRQDRDDVLHAADVLERVQRELERLAAEQQQPVGRRLADADRAVRAADAAQVVGDRVAAQQRHLASSRGRSGRRPAGRWSGCRWRCRRRGGRVGEVDDGDHVELVDARDPVDRRDVVGDLARTERAAVRRLPVGPRASSAPCCACRRRGPRRRARSRRSRSRPARRSRRGTCANAGDGRARPMPQPRPTPSGARERRLARRARRRERTICGRSLIPSATCSCPSGRSRAASARRVFSRSTTSSPCSSLRSISASAIRSIGSRLAAISAYAVT